jgi:hydroxymethylbilane synthase
VKPGPEPIGARALRIGTRGSALALAQSGQTAKRIEALGLRTELVVIRTTGDRLTDVSLAKVGGKGLFLKELEEALLAGEIDLAIHSMKDVPAQLGQEFSLAAVTRRADVRDVLVAADAARDAGSHGTDACPAPLRRLRPGSRVGTGSLRRRAQLAALRPDLAVLPMRGNVDTRLRKLAAGDVDAVVLAAAGIERLGLDVRAEPLEPDLFLPAPGQGALAIEVRRSDHELHERLAPLHDGATSAACTAERAFLLELGASCQVPVAALARVDSAPGGRLVLDGLVASLDGRDVLRERGEGGAADAGSIGRRLAAALLQRGARELLVAAERETGAL